MTALDPAAPAAAGSASGQAASVFGSLPRRVPLVETAAGDESVWLSFGAREPKASTFRALLRSLRWMFAMALMIGRSLVDYLRGRRSDRDRGRRLRLLFEGMGGTAVKVGQQMSVRIDLLPYEVCEELAKLQDQVPPFPVEYAIARIEATTGKRLDEIFAAFDPVPIGSASIACVFQATLRSGEAVAVKVRRPGIVNRFLTDLQFVDWFTQSIEALALVKPGFFKHLRSELREMLMEELDFEREARYQRLFRRMTKKSRLKWLSAPKIYSDYCSMDVIVSEYVDGVWCREMLAAVGSDDRDALARIEAMDIAPREVAYRLLYTQFWSSYESIFFHADPHPSNILIARGGRVLFLDFGACGTTSSHVRRHQQALLDSLVENNVTGMVDAAVHLLTPLPPIDVSEFKRKIEATYHRQIFALRDKDAEWWERTTMGLWLAMVQVTQEFKLPINLDVIRQFRSSLLYDTLAYRLDPDLKLPPLYRRYRRQATARAARREMRHALRREPREYREELIERIAAGVDDARDALRETETVMHDLPVTLEAVLNKGAYAVHVIFYSVIAAVGVVGLAALWICGRMHHCGSLMMLLDSVIRNLFVRIALLLIGVKAIRHLFFRLRDRDYQTGSRLPWR